MDKTLGYFKWLCQLVDPENRYELLLGYLYNVDFYAILEMDNNRIDDALYFRDQHDLNHELITRNAKVLEVMISLANRCSLEYLGNVLSWFWAMMNSLGLSDMDDLHYNEAIVSNKIFRFLNREYQSNGKGGLFTVTQSNEDMRDIEIWYQMTLYLSELI